jgi:hypothetical protein
VNKSKAVISTSYIAALTLLTACNYSKVSSSSEVEPIDTSNVKAERFVDIPKLGEELSASNAEYIGCTLKNENLIGDIRTVTYSCRGHLLFVQGHHNPEYPEGFTGKVMSVLN